MSVAVPMQWHKEHVARIGFQRANTVEPEPFFACQSVLHPVRVRSPLRLNITVPFHERTGVEGRFEFSFVNVHLSLRKVRESPGVVDIQVGQNNVTNVARFESHANDLADCRFFRVQARAFHKLRTSGNLKRGDKVLTLGAEATKFMLGGFLYVH